MPRGNGEQKNGEGGRGVKELMGASTNVELTPVLKPALGREQLGRQEKAREGKSTLRRTH